MKATTRILAAGLVGVWLSLWCAGPDQALAGEAPSDNLSKDSVPVTLHELVLVDQDGKQVSFASEVVSDRVAVVIPYYTTCTSTYPVLVYTFTRLQELLGDRLGKEVVLVAVTVDPKTDLPVRMKAFAQRQKARPGWVFLTGEKQDLGRVLQGVGILFSSNLDEHNHVPITMVGRAGIDWRRYHGFPPPEQLKAQIDKLLVDTKGHN